MRARALWQRYRRWRRRRAEREEAEMRRKGRLRWHAEGLGKAVLAALVLRAFVVQAYEIPSGSMIPTLQVGDRVFVNKLAHTLSPPRRGEVIVFSHPREDKTLIKRIVAVPGDLVELRADVLHVNGRPVAREPLGPRRYHDFDETSGEWLTRDGEAFAEHLDGSAFVTLHEPGGDPARWPRSFGPVTVPPRSVFVMGDNRDNSSDSRFWGVVPYDLIDGEALFVLWSYGRPEGVRFGRLLHRIN